MLVKARGVQCISPDATSPLNNLVAPHSPINFEMLVMKKKKGLIIGQQMVILLRFRAKNKKGRGPTSSSPKLKRAESE